MPSEGDKMQLNKEEYKNFKQIVNIFYNEEIEGINEDKEKIAELDLSASQFFSHSDPEMVKWMAGRKLDI